MSKRPWYVRALARIEEKARAEHSMSVLIELCDDLRSSEITEAERGSIVAELDRMIEELVRPSEEIARDYLRKVRQEIVSE